MTPREGTTAELQVGMYIRSPKGTDYRVDQTSPVTLWLVDRSGNRVEISRPWQPAPVTILEPTEAEALTTVQAVLGAEVEAVRDAPGEPFRIVGLGNHLAQWHTHLHLMHGLHTRTGPGSKSIEKVKDIHTQDHADAELGTPLGAYVRHQH